ICDLSGGSMSRVCNKMVIAFAIVTLFCMNGCNKKTVSALLSTLCVLAMVMTVFSLVVHHTEELDFSTMEYLDLRSIDNPEEIFYAEILLSGLGAIMDVAVDISTALSEIIKLKPEISFRQLFRSGREIGHDIMGTMINILLFVFISGLIPMCLIRMNNDVSFLTIIRLHILCELCRFFVESIGIVLAIPVSVLITSGILKSNLKKRTTLC
ncbi:YibE/F family protein, partial [Eubacterium ramulus]